MKSVALHNGVLAMARRSVHVLMAAGLAVTTAACSGNPATAVSPSAVMASSLDAQGGVIREFSVSILETTVPQGAATLHVTITRSVTSDASQKLGSAQFVVPSGLTVVGVGNFNASAKTWTGSASGQIVTVGAVGGTDKLVAGESVSFTLDVNSAACAKYVFAKPTASNETIGGVFSSQWTFLGSAPELTTTGCVTCNAPEAPSISHAYFTASVANGGLGLPANDPRHGQVQSAVAHEQAADKSFHGLSPCAPGFAAAVKAFVDDFLANYGS